MFNFTTCLEQTIGNAHLTEQIGVKRLSLARRRLKLSTRCLALLALLLCLGPSALAQVLYGSLVGNVSDPNGAAVGGAKVELTNVATGVVSTVMTDDRGTYSLNDLQVGVYKVAISRSSFKTTVNEGLRIDANKTYRFDARLEIGGLEETVLVTAGQETPLQTDRADLNATQTARQINNLPLFGSVGRNYQSMIQLIPGTTRGTGSFFLNATGSGEDNSAAGNPQRSISYNVNGVSRLQNNTRIDGASIIYPWLPTNTVYVPPAEAIQEVNIVTNAFDAEQGLAGGAAINVSIKSGGNDFHGAGWGYTTNSRFRSRRFFQAANQVNNPKDILAQFGYAFSGPIILPNFGEGGPSIWSGKNKLFFFTDLERTTQRNAAGATASVAPAPAAVEDGRCALRWLTYRAREYSLDPTKLVLTGTSAGGHLALMTGMLPAKSVFDRQCAVEGAARWGSAEVPETKVAAIVNWFGIGDVADLVDGPNARNYVREWFGSMSNAEQLAKQLSPVNNVRAGLPPIITIHGEHDDVAPYNHAVRLHELLDKAGVPNQLVTIRGRKHGGFNRQELIDSYAKIREFLKKQGLL